MQIQSKIYNAMFSCQLGSNYFVSEAAILRDNLFSLLCILTYSFRPICMLTPISGTISVRATNDLAESRLRCVLLESLNEVFALFSTLFAILK